MTKQKSSFFFSALLGLGMLTIILATGCNDDKKSTTTETMSTDTMTVPDPNMDPMTPMHGDTMGMDTATTRPIVPGT